MANNRITKFANLVVYDYEQAMEKFYEKVAAKANEEGLGPRAVYEALIVGYGSEIADGWSEWYGNED